jgi:hypothetical protein
MIYQPIPSPNGIFKNWWFTLSDLKAPTYEEI